MTPAKNKNHRQPPKTDDSIQWVSHIIGVTKMIGAVVVALGAIYGAAWSVGLAPVGNGKVSSMIEESIATYDLKVLAQMTSNSTNYNLKLDTLDTKARTLSEQNSRIDERTQGIQQELKNQRDLQNQILLELRNKK